MPYPPIFIKRKSANYLGFRGYAPDASFPVPTRLASGKCGSICEGRGRPRMISTAFDPAFLSTRKGVARRPNLAITCQSFIRSCHKAHAVLWHLLSLCGERRQRRRIICRFSHHENRRQRYHLNQPIQIGAAALVIFVVLISYLMFIRNFKNTKFITSGLPMLHAQSRFSTPSNGKAEAPENLLRGCFLHHIQLQAFAQLLLRRVFIRQRNSRKRLVAPFHD